MALLSAVALAAPGSAVALTTEATTIKILPSQVTSVFGTLVSYDAQVSAAGSVPTGTVQFSDEGFPLGPPEPLNSEGRLEEPPQGFLDVGTTLTARYSGDSAHDPSETSLPLEISPAATTLSLRSSANPQTPGQPVTITATVTNTESEFPPFGSVQFVVNGKPVLEPLPLGPEGETGIIGHLPVGSYAIFAEYHDDTAEIPDFRGSSGSLTQIIGSPPPPPPPVPAPIVTPTVPPAPAQGGTLGFSSALVLGRPVVSRSGRITITAHTADPGRISAAARTRSGFLAAARRPGPASYGRSLTTVPGGRTVTLTVNPGARARRALRAGRTLHLTLEVTFQPSGGGKPTRLTVHVTARSRHHR